MSSRAEARRAKRDLNGNTNRGHFIAVLYGVPRVVLVVLVVVVAYSFLLGRTRFGQVYLRHRRQRRGGPAGRHQPEPDPARRVHAGRADGGDHGHHLRLLPRLGLHQRPGRDNVLYAVAAAVIGGTSLFGGRGQMLGAVLGGVIVAVIYNGLELLGLGAAAQYMWTAAVLLAAVTVDTVARRGRTST